MLLSLSPDCLLPESSSGPAHRVTYLTVDSAGALMDSVYIALRVCMFPGTRRLSPAEIAQSLGALLICLGQPGCPAVGFLGENIHKAFIPAFPHVPGNGDGDGESTQNT